MCAVGFAEGTDVLGVGVGTYEGAAVGAGSGAGVGVYDGGVDGEGVGAGSGASDGGGLGLGVGIDAEGLSDGL